MKELAHKYHAGQKRKGEGNIPYIVHPEAVVDTLLKWGVKPDSPMIPIAWGHDLLEDTKVTEAEILNVSDETVLAGIKMLTRPREADKKLYLEGIADSGNRDILLVKVSDRICNSKDFIKLEGKLSAYRYLHEADCLYQSLKKISNDQVAQNALTAWESLDNELREPARRDAIRGCLIGGAAGDALGSPLEFLRKESIEKIYGKNVSEYVEFSDGTGSITDDTQMTLFTVEGLLRANVRNREKGICDPVSVMRFAYLRWLKTQGIEPEVPEDFINSGWLIQEKQLFQQRAPGNTCITSLESKSVPARNNSKGCGTVMRMAPVGLFFEPEQAYDYGCKFSALTHGHPTGITSGGAFAMLIAYLMQGKTLSESLDLTARHLKKIPAASETLAAIRCARTASDISEIGEGWVAEEALAIGIYCAVHHKWNFKAGVIEAVNIDGDSDSTGAIAGNILGVMLGENCIPEGWRKNLQEYEIVSRTADDLYRIFECNESGHVTEDWWEKYPGF